MGQSVPVQRPLFPLRRWSKAVLLAATALLMLVALSASGSAEEEAWGSLEMADVPVGTPLTVVDDDVSFRLYAHWGGAIEERSTLLVIDPLPEGWTYHVDDAIPTDSGFLLDEEGIISVTVDVGEASDPGRHYLEPRLDHLMEGRSLASVPVILDVKGYYMVPVVDSSPDPSVVPGQRLRWTVGVGAGAPVDKLVRLEVVFAPQGWAVSTPWRSAFVRDGTAEPVTFTISVDEHARPGEYTVIFGIRTPDPRVTTYTVVENLTVERVLDLRTTASDLHLTAYVGGGAMGDLTLSNDGNVPLTILGVVPDDYVDLPTGWRVVADGVPAPVQPSSEATLRVGVDLPEDATASPSGGHLIPVQLLTDRGTLDVDAVLEVFVPELRKSWFSVQDTWRADTANVNEMSLRLHVVDGGNVVQERAVWLSFEAGPEVAYIGISEPAMMMSSGSVGEVELTVRVDPEAVPGEHSIVIRAHDGSGLLAEVEVPIQVAQPRLMLVGGLEVRAVQDDGHYAGTEARVFVVTGTVENAGDRHLAFAKVEVFDISSGEPVDLGYVPIHDLPVGASHPFRFTLDRARPGENAVLAHPSVPGTNGDPFKDSLESRFEAQAVTPAPDGRPVFLLLAIAIGSLAGLVAILTTEAGRFALLVFILVPLYTRLKPEQVTDHFVRGQILGYVKANPGETYTRIRKALGLSNGTFVYHSRILESQGHIRSVKDGANRRFYPADMRIPSDVKDVQLNQVQRMIYTIVMEYPGISQSRIAKMVKLAPSTVNYHVNIMTKVGIVERKRSGRLSLIFAADEGE
jgi:predicted transcriptional regulator/uncharacterized membrane protein